MENQKPKQNGVENLTFQQNVVKDHKGLDALSGYVVVVFEKLNRGGESFARLVSSGERSQWKFNLPFWDQSKKYYAVAVNQSVLSYSFAELVTLDDGIHEFTLDFHLKYRATDPQRVAELREQDPLRKLRDEIALVIGRSCKQRKWQMVRDRFRELEMVVMNSERTRLRQYATTLGIEILSIEMDRILPAKVIDGLKAPEEIEAERQKLLYEQKVKETQEEIEHRRHLKEIENQYDARAAELNKQQALKEAEEAAHRDKLNRELREGQNEAIVTAYKNVGNHIKTPEEFVEAVESAHRMRMTIQSDNGTPGSSAELSAGASVKYLNAYGGDGVSSLLNQAFTYIDQWGCPFAQKQALRSAILHIVAEVLLDDRADDALLKQYVDKLSEIGSNLQATPAQFRFLDRFRKYEQLRDSLMRGTLMHDSQMM